MSFRPAARHIGEHRQDRQFVIVIPKNKRIVPEKNEAEEDDDQPCRCRTENLRARGTRSGHPRKENAERPTSNVQLGNSQRHLAFFSAVRILEKKILMSSSVSLRIAAVFADGM